MYASPLGAHEGNRTPDPLVKSQLLYLLSYMSVLPNGRFAVLLSASFPNHTAFLIAYICPDGSPPIRAMHSMDVALEPLTGIGPAHPAWKAGVLPLNYSDEWCRERIPPAPGGLLVFPSRQKTRGRNSYGGGLSSPRCTAGGTRTHDPTVFRARLPTALRRYMGAPLQVWGHSQGHFSSFRAAKSQKRRKIMTHFRGWGR